PGGAGTLAVDERDDLLAALDVEAPVRVGEVILDVDHEQGRLLVVRREVTHRLLPSWTALSVGSRREAVVSMDIEEFYDQDPRRQASEEIEFGREWYENDERFEVAWVADTGEVYAMAEPYSRRGVSTQSVTVEV